MDGGAAAAGAAGDRGFGGAVLRGRVWVGGSADPADPIADGVVVVDASGRVAAVGPAGAVDLPAGVPTLGGAEWWVGPGARDAHVHLAFGGPDAMLAGGVVAVRDLGAPLPRALDWRAASERVGGPAVDVVGEILTAPGGYPSRSWGADGFARFVADAAEAERAVSELAAAGVDAVKLAFEPRGGPILGAAAASAAVATAHRLGLPTTAHALTVAMVERALDAGVDELAHTPTEEMPPSLVERIVDAGVAVTSTVWTFVAGGEGAGAVANLRRLVEHGARLRYGTDVGNTGTRSGVEPRELRLLADAGLGRAGALRLVTAGWPTARPGPRPGAGAGDSAGADAPDVGTAGTIAVGEPAALVALDGDPLADPEAWRRVRAVVTGRRVTRLG